MPIPDGSEEISQIINESEENVKPRFNPLGAVKLSHLMTLIADVGLTEALKESDVGHSSLTRVVRYLSAEGVNLPPLSTKSKILYTYVAHELNKQGL